MQTHGFDIGLSPYFASAVDGDRQIQKVHLFGWLGHLPIPNSELQFFPHKLVDRITRSAIVNACSSGETACPARTVRLADQIERQDRIQDGSI